MTIRGRGAVGMMVAGLAVVGTACVPPSPPPGPDGTVATAAPSSSGATTPTTPTTAGSTSTTTTSSTSTTTTLPAPTTTLPDVTALYRATPVDGWGIQKDTPVAFAEYVDAVEIVGDTVYAGGDFATAVKGSLTAPRGNLMAIRASTGDLLPFRADTNGTVNAIVSDGSSLYIGGDFTTVNGVPRNRLAKLDLTTGAVDLAFDAGAGSIVQDMVLREGRLYIVGEFNLVNGVQRRRAAVVNTTNGGLDPTFNPDVDAKVLAIAVSPNGSKVYIGGNFTTVGGVSREFMAEIHPDTGVVQGPVFDRAGAIVLALSVNRDGTKVYGGTKFNIAVQWNATTGNDEWAIRADGDTQAVVYSNGYVYQGFHDGYLGDTSLRVQAIAPSTGEVQAGFQPASASHPGVWCLEADGNYLVAGGYFATMAGG